MRWGGRQDYLPCKGLPRRSTPKAGSADSGIYVQTRTMFPKILEFFEHCSVL